MPHEPQRIDVDVEGRLPRDFALSRDAFVAAARFFAQRSSARTGARWHAVTVHLVRDAASDACHRAIMGIAGATDVITQAYDAIPPEPPGLFGELFVNTDQARCAAPARRGWTKEKELLLYLAHGMDHLSGADDQTPRQYAQMRRRELAWIRALPPSR